MDWTIGPAMFWTIFWTNLWTILLGEAKPSVLKEGCSLSLQYLGRGGRQIVVTKGGVEDELWSFHQIIQIIFSGFLTD